MSIQPDLFGDYDRAQEQAQRWRQPATCPACGTQEPSGYLLRQNHGAVRAPDASTLRGVQGAIRGATVSEAPKVCTYSYHLISLRGCKLVLGVL